MIAWSLILTGFFQLAFTRFVADRLFEGRPEVVVPNYHAVLLVVAVLAGTIGLVALTLFFPVQTILYRVLALAGFVLLSLIWIATVFLSGMKQYRAIVAMYFFGYGATVLFAMALRGLGLEGLLAGFVLGQILLFAGMQTLILRDFPAPRFMSFECFRVRLRYPTLAWIGFLFNLGVWIDKFIFWAWPPTSQAVIGPLRASIIYDLPVFMAYLSIIPGMAVFLLRLETDFVDYYDAFFKAVREGESLATIERLRNGIVSSARTGILDIIKVQSIAALLVIGGSTVLLQSIGISTLYAPLLHVMVIGAGLQVVLLGILNVLYYLDRRRLALILTLLFLGLNALFTGITLDLGPEFFGYGYAGSLLVVTVVGLMMLDRVFERLEYETFMLQPG